MGSFAALSSCTIFHTKPTKLEESRYSSAHTAMSDCELCRRSFSWAIWEMDREMDWEWGRVSLKWKHIIYINRKTFVYINDGKSNTMLSNVCHMMWYHPMTGYLISQEQNEQPQGTLKWGRTRGRLTI
jgi:hypothetical protein